MTIEEYVPLAPFATFHLGGPARYFARVKNTGELSEAITYTHEHKLSFVFLGGGSNVLFSDSGFDGIVIRIELKGIEIEGNTLTCAAGESWDGLVLRSVQENLWGLENLSGIPGTVGGAVAGSIGAYGQSISQSVSAVEVLDTHTGALCPMTARECSFGYRESFFSHNTPRYVITSVTFTLSREKKPELSYRDLAERFGGNEPSLSDIRSTVLQIRAGKFPDLTYEGSAGSFFKNPVVGAREARALKVRYPGLPVFALPESKGVKVPLAWFLDNVLSLKGFTLGGARLFEKQPLVIAVRAGATARDVRSLAEIVKKKIFDEIQIHIEEEVRVIEKSS